MVGFALGAAEVCESALHEVVAMPSSTFWAGRDGVAIPRRNGLSGFRNPVSGFDQDS
jgi:hypothetical protein